MKKWFEDAWWSWRCCIHSRFDYNDNIDVAAFWEELNYGWYQMESVLKNNGGTDFGNV
jgi:hypothetical protein